MTPLYFELPERIIFKEYKFKPIKKEKFLPIEELELLKVFDVNRYKKLDLW